MLNSDLGYRLTLGGRLTPVIKWLIIINGVFFAFQKIYGVHWFPIFGLVPEKVISQLMVWQLGTYMFLHGGFFHLLFNMFILWMFGNEIERHWGSRAFLFYYFLTGVGAGLFTLIFSWGSPIPTIGASGAIFGVLVAYGMMFPNRIVYLYFLFPIKAKYLVLLFGVIELLATLSFTPDGIGHLTHLGGMVVGYFYIKYNDRLMLWRTSVNRHREARLRRLELLRGGEIQRMRERMDELLDKINEVGIENLTKKEREFLKRASRWFARQKEPSE